MKKNASCKGIRTNQGQASYFRPLSKKPLNLDLVQHKPQSPKLEQPMTAKSPAEQALRKKIFSSSKNLIPNNENISEANITVVPTSPLGQSNRAYDQLKNKISNLEGRLVQIKKNFQGSFHKRSQKSKTGKENVQGAREKQKSRLVLAKYQEKPDKLRHDKTEKVLPKAREVKEKQQPIKRANVQLKADKGDEMLQDYVTTFTCQSPTMLTHCSSDANLFKPHKYSKSKKPVQQRYYIDAVINAYSASQPTSFDQLCKTHLNASIDILQYIKSGNKGLPTLGNLRHLPPTKKPTLIFDLDETLIHCNQNANMPCDVLLPIKFPNGATVKAGVNIRPYARECLEQLSKDFELIVFTASHECYANVIVDYIDQKRLISHRYFRDSCWKSEQGFYVKDLRVVDRDLRNVLLIDNAAYSYSFQLDNGVPIVPFYNNKADLELKSFVSYAKGLPKGQDIRQSNAKVMKLGDYTTVKDSKSLLAKLYGWQRQN